MQVKESISHLSLQLPEGPHMGRSVKLKTLLANYFHVRIQIAPSMCVIILNLPDLSDCVIISQRINYRQLAQFKLNFIKMDMSSKSQNVDCPCVDEDLCIRRTRSSRRPVRSAKLRASPMSSSTASGASLVCSWCTSRGSGTSLWTAENNTGR